MIRTKFEQPRQSTTNSIILKRQPTAKPHVNLIIEMPMEQSELMEDSLISNISNFEVEDSGYYHISTQVCLQNDTKQNVKIDFIQFGIVAKDAMETDCKNNVKSTINEVIVKPDYFTSDSNSTVMFLERNIKYIFWLNVGSDSIKDQPGNKLRYLAPNSHCRIYKL